ncbi:MAG: hypothetical protein K2M36_06275, partial [Clostridia bacterium]|nr:hypothetical protein [Clostridia bacterium]
IEVFESIDEALRGAFRTAKALECVNILFSPSSKSFDKFTSYEMRGKHFDACVRKLISEV